MPWVSVLISKMFSHSLKIVHTPREGQAIHIACRVQKPRPSLTLSIGALALWRHEDAPAKLQYLHTACMQKQQLKVVSWNLMQLRNLVSEESFSIIYCKLQRGDSQSCHGYQATASVFHLLMQSCRSCTIDTGPVILNIKQFTGFISHSEKHLSNLSPT